VRTVLRPLGFVLVSGASLAAFIAAGAATPDPVDLADVSGWLDRVDPVDALVEVARVAGIVLATYVLVVSLLALVAELAGLARLARIQRLVSGIARAIALPSLRRWLLELGTAASLSAATIPSLAMAAPATPVTQVAEVDAPPAPFALGAEFRGFDLPADQSPPEAAIHVVERGDTLWSIITAHYGRFDRELLDSVLAANPQIEDPNLILVGWQITLPALPDERVVVPGEPAPVPKGESSWSAVTVRRGDTLWEIVDRHYGNATAELIWAVVDANPEIENPDLIHAGQVITLPPLGSAEVTEPGVDPLSDEQPASATSNSPTSTLPTPTSAPEAPPTEPVSDEAAPTGITPSMPVEPSAATPDDQRNGRVDDRRRPGGYGVRRRGSRSVGSPARRMDRRSRAGRGDPRAGSAPTPPSATARTDGATEPASIAARRCPPVDGESDDCRVGVARAA
jgi:nucleoid-associated protein YgaU